MRVTLKPNGMSAIVVENCSKAVEKCLEIITEFLFVDIEMLQNHCGSHSVLQGHKFWLCRIMMVGMDLWVNLGYSGNNFLKINI